MDMLPNSADILVTEIFDSVLLGEGVLPTLQHAWEYLLAPHAIVVPDRAVVFAQVRTPALVYLNAASSVHYLIFVLSLSAGDVAHDSCYARH